MAMWIVFALISLVTLSMLLSLIVSRSFREDMLAGSGEAKVLKIMSVRGASMVIIFSTLIGALIYVAEQLEDAELPIPFEYFDSGTRAINGYYDALNRGIGGESEGYAEAWRYLSGDFRRRQKEQYSHFTFPDDYSTLYRESGIHTPIAIFRLSDRADGERQYYVVQHIVEMHVRNPYAEQFSQQTTDKLKDDGYLSFDEKTICRTFMELLNDNYILDNNYDTVKTEICELIQEQYLNRIIGHRFISEIAADLELSTSQDFRPSSFDSYDGIRVTLIRGNEGKWKIHANRRETSFFRERN